MNRLARLSLLPAACAFVAACASAAPHPPRDEPPEMVSRGASPDLQIPTSAMAARTALEVNIEVLIDENGSPDMSTFKVTGIGAEDNRDALARWIEQARFPPCTASWRGCARDLSDFHQSPRRSTANFTGLIDHRRADERRTHGERR